MSIFLPQFQHINTFTGWGTLNAYADVHTPSHLLVSLSCTWQRFHFKNEIYTSQWLSSIIPFRVMLVCCFYNSILSEIVMTMDMSWSWEDNFYVHLHLVVFIFTHRQRETWLGLWGKKQTKSGNLGTARKATENQQCTIHIFTARESYF